MGYKQYRSVEERGREDRHGLRPDARFDMAAAWQRGEEAYLQAAAKLAHSPTVSVGVGGVYTDEEAAFMRKLDWYKRKYNRPFPTCREVLAILRVLGYQKTSP